MDNRLWGERAQPWFFVVAFLLAVTAIGYVLSGLFDHRHVNVFETWIGVLCGLLACVALGAAYVVSELCALQRQVWQLEVRLRRPFASDPRAGSLEQEVLDLWEGARVQAEVVRRLEDHVLRRRHLTE